ncbi:hypothetical protein HYW21_05880 [Candidatus Woesearchaeota archaeon]|nr:hypothetical protein [Candidatus Woesearchaeota archaeon]
MKKPKIVIIMLILTILATIGLFFKVIDMNEREILIEVLGPILGNFEYGMNIFYFIFSLALVVGYFSAKQWAWEATFYYYGIYFVGQIISLVYGIFHPEKLAELTSMLRYGDVRPLPFPPEFFVYVTLAVTTIQTTIVFFILRAVYKNKEYFRN